jgi:hypothetical protein
LTCASSISFARRIAWRLPPRSGVFVDALKQTTDELIQYANECCVLRELTAAERQQFGLAAK